MTWHVQSGGRGDEAAGGEGPRDPLGVGDNGTGFGCDQASGEQVGHVAAELPEHVARPEATANG